MQLFSAHLSLTQIAAEAAAGLAAMACTAIPGQLEVHKKGHDYRAMLAKGRAGESAGDSVRGY